jgi:hypothetical protein
MFSDDLVEWTSVYVKNKNMANNDVSISEYSGRVVCKSSSGNHTYLISPMLSIEVLKNLDSEKVSVVCLNNRQNLEFIIKNWDKLVKFQKLSIIFVHPKSNTKWIIFPHTHNSISPNIKLGLNAMFQTVMEVQ